MSAPVNLWVVRALWLGLPFTLLESILRATEGTSPAVRATAQILFWTLWAGGVVVSLLPLPSTLTALRIIVPLAPSASLAAAFTATQDPPGWIGLAIGTAASVVVMSARVGDWFVDGASYGDERRFALRPPVVLLLGPLPLAWLVTVGPLLVGVVLFANDIWYVAMPLVLFGIAATWWGCFALWRLARRWLVFVPAGLTVVDEMALTQPVLFARRALARVGPAHVETEALDLSVGAPGLVIEMTLDAPVELVPAAGRGKETAPRSVTGVLVVPSRPAAVLDHAQLRSLPVARN